MYIYQSIQLRLSTSMRTCPLELLMLNAKLVVTQCVLSVTREGVT